MWAVLCWLQILAVQNQKLLEETNGQINEESQISAIVTVADVLANHWKTYGRSIYARYDWEEVDGDKARGFMKDLEAKMAAWPGKKMQVGATEVSNTEVVSRR